MKVLVVDDSVAMRMIVKKMVKAAGFSADFIEAADGQIGLEKIREESPDLVLCDWNMPNMSGIELLAALNDEGIAVDFGFVTTESSDEMRMKAEELGAKFLIVKPFTAETVFDALKSFF